MVSARPVVRLALMVVGGMAALACGFAEVFRSAGPEAVTIIYVGDTVLHRDSTVPFSVVVDARGTLLDRPHLTCGRPKPAVSIPPPDEAPLGPSRVSAPL